MIAETMLCECGKGEGSWHGSRRGYRAWCCLQCWEEDPSNPDFVPSSLPLPRCDENHCFCNDNPGGECREDLILSLLDLLTLALPYVQDGEEFHNPLKPKLSKRILEAITSVEE